MKNILLTSLILFLFTTIHAQKMITRTGKVSFLSSTPIEKIEAENNQVASILFTDSHKIAFNVLMKSFQFEKALMQEHFNEKYVHSDQYPAAKFKGDLPKDIDWSQPSTHTDVTINGLMVFHGVSKPIQTQANLVINPDHSIVFTTQFGLQLADYNIEIPSLIQEKVSQKIEVKVAARYQN